MKRNRILLDPLPAAGGGTPPPAKPAAAVPTPAAAPAPAPTPAAAPAPAAVENDDPFALPAAAPAADDTDKLAPKELRERVKQLRTENQSFQGAKKTLEDKIAFLESRGIDAGKFEKQLSDLKTAHDSIAQERDAALAELRAARQEASPEFKEKYDKPFNAAAERAKAQVGELTVTNAEDGTSRAATWQDFAALYSLPTGKAIEQATAMFGSAANYVLGLREKLLDLDTSRQTALAEEKTKFKERTAIESANQEKEKGEVNQRWEETNKRLSETVADYKVDPTDTEATEAYKHAISVFDAPVKGADRADFIAKKIVRDAHIRQRVAAFAVTKVKLSRAESKIATLEAQIAELKGAAPGGTARPGGTETGGETEGDWKADLQKAIQGV